MNNNPSLNPKLKIGLAGTGVVGKALIQLLNNSQLPLKIQRCLVRRDAVAQSIPVSTCNHIQELIHDPEIDVIVEATNDTGFALALVHEATQAGKPVITANKQLIANHLLLIKKWQYETGTPVLYESSCGAGIPMIRLLEDYFQASSIREIRGIINGSTNYILTRMERSGVAFKEALLEAQQAGYAEKDSSLDIEGTDAASKLCILLEHAFGSTVLPRDILCDGIQRITQPDHQEAASRGCRIKLIARAVRTNDGHVTAWVLPAFIPEADNLYHTEFENNALEITDCWNNHQVVSGKGAGGNSTAAGLIQDLLALKNGYRYPYRKSTQQTAAIDLNESIKVYFRYEGFFEKYAQWFEQIEQFNQSEHEGAITGIVRLKNLKNNSWWRNENCSLIAFLQPVTTTASEHQLHRRALELACAPVFN